MTKPRRKPWEPTQRQEKRRDAARQAVLVAASRLDDSDADYCGHCWDCVERFPDPLWGLAWDAESVAKLTDDFRELTRAKRVFLKKLRKWEEANQKLLAARALAK